LPVVVNCTLIKSNIAQIILTKRAGAKQIEIKLIQQFFICIIKELFQDFQPYPDIDRKAGTAFNRVIEYGLTPFIDSLKYQFTKSRRPAFIQPLHRSD
jgi:hypothetical protein